MIARLYEAEVRLRAVTDRPYINLLHTKRKEKRADHSALVFVWDVLHNIFHLAVQDSAKCVDRVGTNTFVALESCDLRGTNAILLDEGILGKALLFHRFPKIVIGNHSTAPFTLDIITDCGI